MADVVVTLTSRQVKYTFRRSGDIDRAWYATSAMDGEVELLSFVRLARAELVTHLDSLVKHLLEE